VYGKEIRVETLVWIYLSQRCCGSGAEISGPIIDGRFLDR
jgi:hypothetical protein